MTFIRLSLKLAARPHLVRRTKPGCARRRRKTLSADVSAFAREPIDFDLDHAADPYVAASPRPASRATSCSRALPNLDYSTSKYFRRVHRVAQRLNYDYSQACEVVAEQVKRDSVQNLLLHFATALSSGESEAEFLERETEVQLELYGKKYERDMESLRSGPTPTSPHGLDNADHRHLPGVDDDLPVRVDAPSSACPSSS